MANLYIRLSDTYFHDWVTSIELHFGQYELWKNDCGAGIEHAGACGQFAGMGRFAAPGARLNAFTVNWKPAAGAINAADCPASPSCIFKVGRGND